MTGNGHRLTTVGAALFGWGAAGYLGGDSLSCSIGAAMAVNAPDYLELQWGKNGAPLIKHRTITHWILPWLLLLYLSAMNIEGTHDVFPELIDDFLLGYAIGGLTHLLADSFNPMGIPVLTPWHRLSFNLWRSGRFELIQVSVFAVAGFLFASPYLNFAL